MEKSRSRDFYQLMADLTDVQLESTRLVLTFEKKNDPELSAKRLKALLGFVVCSFRGRKKTSQDEHRAEDAAQIMLA